MDEARDVIKSRCGDIQAQIDTANRDITELDGQKQGKLDFIASLTARLNMLNVALAALSDAPAEPAIPQA